MRSLRIASKTAFVLTAAVGVVWAAVEVEQFLINERTFFLPGPPEPGIPSDHFQVQGVQNASEARITAVFHRDFGRSIYLCPIAERRRRLLGIDWVKDASVSRVWPNRILVRITERTPVAFIQRTAADGTVIFGLIDEEGVLLDPQRTANLTLPVLSGVAGEEKNKTRAEQVRRFLRLQSELGQEMSTISEIDVSDVDNLKVTVVDEGRALTLMLGNQQFLRRYHNFSSSRDEIRKRLPNALVLDLRLRDRITAVASRAPAPNETAPKQAARKQSRPKQIKRKSPANE